MKFRPRCPWLLGVLLCLVSPAGAEDFAIRTQIFQDDQPRAVAENLTVFRDDAIYDFLITEPQTATIFDVPGRRFTLTDPGRSQQTVVAADELIRFASEEHTKALKSPNELVRFATAPKFEESFDEATGRLTLTSPLWDYEVETESWSDAEQAKRYGEFVHWYAYLNAMFRPLPPGLRLELNQALARHHRYPTRVIVRIKQNGDVVMRQESRHQVIKQLTASETKRLENWLENQPSLHLTDFVSFRRSQLKQ